MDHEDVLEQLELAAVEPGGLDRLMAGDTAMAAAVVGHLAGCEPCSEEFRRLSRAVPLVRDLVRTTPSGDLRERTLAYVRTHGRPRGDGLAPRPGAVPDPMTPVIRARRAASRTSPWAAVAVVALLVGGAAFLSARADIDRYERVASGLEAVTQATIDLTEDADAQRVALASTDGAATAGTLLFSPTTTELVVVANDLPTPPSGSEYRCWVEVDGTRQDVGRMFFGEDLAFWVGDTPAVSDLPEGTTFGVSLVDVGDPSLEADPVIIGQL